MERSCRLLCLLAGLLGSIPTAWAMSYVPMSDEALLGQADLVIAGIVTGAMAASGQELNETEYVIAVTDVLKGRALGETLRIRIPGGIDPAAEGALIVPAAPRFATEEKVLLFLSPRADGTYTTIQLVLGAFHYRDSSEGEAVLDQDLSQAVAQVSDESVPHRRYRQARHFEQWLRDQVAGRSGDASYWSGAVDLRQMKYALTNPLGRWFEFDQGLSVPVYASEAGQSGLSSGGHAELQQALGAWNDAGSLVSLVYMGKSSATGGLGIADGVTEVLFNDPNNEISGSFDCIAGGIGAYARWRGGATRWYRGELYRVITEGDIVVQDGIGCLLSRTGKNNTQELLAHELGHLLGLDHSCGDGLLSVCAPGSAQDDALMRPTLHGDGRGSHLNADDLAGLAALYGGTDGSGSAATAVPADSSGGGGLGLPLLSLFSIFAARGLRRRLP